MTPELAGVGRFATERQLAADLAMIQLNVTTLVELHRAAAAGHVGARSRRDLECRLHRGLPAGPWAGGLQRHQRLPEVIQSGSQRGDAQHWRTRHRFVPWPGGHRIREGCRLSATHIEKSADESFVRRSGGAAGWQGLAAGKPVVVPDLLTRIRLQSLRVLPWQMIARASQSRHRGGR